MAEDIYINTDQPIDRAVVAGANQPTRRLALAEFVEGATQTANLYFVKNDGTFDARSGDAAVAVKASVGRDNAVPASGTFKITDYNGQDTADISYGASAQAVEDALNALNGGLGISYFIDAILVAGAGTSEANGTYLRDGIYNGRPSYINSENGNTIISDFVFGQNLEWIITIYDPILGVSAAAYYSQDQVATPDLASNWIVPFGSDSPAPNVTIATDKSLVDVTKQSDTLYTVINRTNGEFAALTGTSIDLTPESSVTPSPAIAGSATQRAQQIIEIKRQPAIYTSAWSTITNGFTGTLSANNARVAQSLQFQSDQPFIFEVSLDGDVVCQVQCEVEPAITPPSAFPADSLPTALSEFAADPSSNASFDVDAWRADLNILTATATLDFPSISANSSQELTITVTGAAVGDVVQLAAPAAINANLLWAGYVSSANTVTVRLSNIDGGSINPISATWGCAVISIT